MPIQEYDCSQIHERLSILETKYKIQEKINEEILSSLKEIKDVLVSIKEFNARSEQKTKNLNDKIQNIENNQKWLVGGIITALLSAIWHILKRFL